MFACRISDAQFIVIVEKDGECTMKVIIPIKLLE